jgi:hypothetical protein
MVFVTNDMNKGWDGRIRSGEEGQIDTYVWRVRFNDTNGNPHEHSGKVSLIR